MEVFKYNLYKHKYICIFICSVYAYVYIRIERKLSISLGRLCILWKTNVFLQSKLLKHTTAKWPSQIFNLIHTWSSVILAKICLHNFDFLCYSTSSQLSHEMQLLPVILNALLTFLLGTLWISNSHFCLDLLKCM